MAAATRELHQQLQLGAWAQRSTAFHPTGTTGYSSLRAMEPLNEPLVSGAPAPSVHSVHEQIDANGIHKSSHSKFLSAAAAAAAINFPLRWPSAQKIGAGLANLGNTCFLNSVLQCLTYTPPLAGYLQSGQHKLSCRVAGFCALCALQEHVVQALASAGKVVQPSKIVRNLRCISRSFRMCRQEDAHEYMRYLVEALHKCCIPSELAASKSSVHDKSLVYKIFGGRLRSQVKCTVCAHCSDTYDPFLDLSLEIVQADSVTKALARFTAVEVLDGGNKYNCSHCQRKVRALKRLTIDTVPNILTIQFKRFSSGSYRGKIDKKVEFGTTLDLGPYASSDKESIPKYSLYAVLVHSGWSTHSGHYYCFVRTSADIWHVLDDSRVKQVSERIVLEQKAYMLFYVRDTRKGVPHSETIGDVRPPDFQHQAPGIAVSLCNGPLVVKEPTALSRTTVSHNADQQVTVALNLDAGQTPIAELSVKHGLKEVSRQQNGSSTCLDDTEQKIVDTLAQVCLPKTDDVNGECKDLSTPECCTSGKAKEDDWDKYYKKWSGSGTSQHSLFKLLRSMPHTRRYFLARALRTTIKGSTASKKQADVGVVVAKGLTVSKVQADVGQAVGKGVATYVKRYSKRKFLPNGDMCQCKRSKNVSESAPVISVSCKGMDNVSEHHCQPAALGNTQGDVSCQQTNMALANPANLGNGAQSILPSTQTSVLQHLNVQSSGLPRDSLLGDFKPITRNRPLITKRNEGARKVGIHRAREGVITDTSNGDIELMHPKDATKKVTEQKLADAMTQVCLPKTVDVNGECRDLSTPECCASGKAKENDWVEYCKKWRCSGTSQHSLIKLLRAMPHTRPYFLARALRITTKGSTASIVQADVGEAVAKGLTVSKVQVDVGEAVGGGVATYVKRYSKRKFLQNGDMCRCKRSKNLSESAAVISVSCGSMDNVSEHQCQPAALGNTQGADVSCQQTNMALINPANLGNGAQSFLPCTQTSVLQHLNVQSSGLSRDSLLGEIKPMTRNRPLVTKVNEDAIEVAIHCAREGVVTDASNDDIELMHPKDTTTLSTAFSGDFKLHPLRNKRELCDSGAELRTINGGGKPRDLIECHEEEEEEHLSGFMKGNSTTGNRGATKHKPYEFEVPPWSDVEGAREMARDVDILVEDYQGPAHKVDLWDVEYDTGRCKKIRNKCSKGNGIVVGNGDNRNGIMVGNGDNRNGTMVGNGDNSFQSFGRSKEALTSTSSENRRWKSPKVSTECPNFVMGSNNSS